MSRAVVMNLLDVKTSNSNESRMQNSCLSWAWRSNIFKKNCRKTGPKSHIISRLKNPSILLNWVRRSAIVRVDGSMSKMQKRKLPTLSVYIDPSVCWTIIMYYFLCSPVTAGSMMKYCAAAARRKRKSKRKREVVWTCVVASHEIFLRLHFTPEIFFFLNMI